MSYAFKRTRKLAFGVMLGAYIFSATQGLHFRSAHHVDARGGAKGSCNRRKDGDGEVQDFLPNVFVHGV